MRTTVAGALLLFGGFIVTKVMVAFNDNRLPTVLALLFAASFLAGVVCLIVGPILWVRGARRTKAEEMRLLREIAAQGRGLR